MKYVTIREGYTVEFPLKPCPWCKNLPETWLPLDQRDGVNETWIWKLHCNCDVHSECSVSLRKTTKSSINRILEKLDELASKWNDKNPLTPAAKKRIDLSDIPNLGVKPSCARKIW